MLLDNRSHLSRLSTLIESNNLTEIDNFSKSPVVTESFDAFHRVALQSPSLRTARPKIPNSEPVPPLPSGSSPSASGQTKKKDLAASTWFLRPMYHDDDISVAHDGTVKAGTLPALAERLTLHYLSAFFHDNHPFVQLLTTNTLESSQETKFRHAFLATFKSFTTADMVFDQLVGWFRMVPPVYLSEDEIEEWREKKQRSTQQRVLTLFTMWLEDHNMIKEDLHIVYRLQGFLQSITDPHPLAIPAKLILEAIDRLVGTQIVLIPPFLT